MKDLMKKLFILLTVLFLVLGTAALRTSAEEDESTRNIVDWTPSDTCEWMIDDEGKLTIRPANGASEGELEDWSNSGAPWYANHNDVTSVVIESGVKAKTCSSMFFDMSNCETMDISGLDTSAVTDMSGMFLQCRSLQSIDVANLNTSSVEKMRSMFNACNSLTELDLSSFDTRNVTDMSAMFWDCMNCKSIDVSSFVTSKVTKMDHMFAGCRSLIELDISNFDTNLITNNNELWTMFGKSSILWLKIGENFCANATVNKPTFPIDLYDVDDDTLYSAGTVIPSNAGVKIYTVRYKLTYDGLDDVTYLYYKEGPATLRNTDGLLRSETDVVAWDIESPATRSVFTPGGSYDFDDVAGTYGEEIETFRSGSEREKPLYWTVGIKYTLSYDANGGTNAPAEQSITDTLTEKDFTIAETTPTRNGYEFLGWASEASATEAEYSAGGTITLTDDKTLFAVWKKNAEPASDTPYVLPKTGVDGIGMSYLPMAALGVLYLIKKNHR